MVSSRTADTADIIACSDTSMTRAGPVVPVLCRYSSVSPDGRVGSAASRPRTDAVSNGSTSAARVVSGVPSTPGRATILSISTMGSANPAVDARARWERPTTTAPAPVIRTARRSSSSVAVT